MLGKMAAAALALSTLSFGQRAYLDDHQMPNGRYWRDTPHIAKLLYLTGITHGLQIALIRAAMDSKCSEKLGSIVDAPPGAIIDDYEKELDKLYSESENLQINIMMAWTYVDLKLKGTLTKEYLEKMLIGLRHDAASHVQH